jgi:hypothetical protein
MIYRQLTDSLASEQVLDESKWDLDTSHWRGRQPGLFDPTNVVVAGGHLQLWARAAKRNSSWPEGYDNFTTSTVRSFAAVKNGYFEIRWRSGSSGISSSWWFTGGNDTTGRVEIDVFETTGADVGPPDDPTSPDWCSTTPFGKCRTGCPADPNGRCGPEKKPFPPGGPSCNECACNKQNTTCTSEMKNTNVPSHVHIWELPGTPLGELPTKCGCTEGHPGKAPCSKGSTATLSTPVSTDFHTASLNWTETEIAVAVDGKVVNRIASPCMVADIQVRVTLGLAGSSGVFQATLLFESYCADLRYHDNVFTLTQMLFDRETMPDWMKIPDPKTLPDSPFEVDYVRSYRRKD